MIKTMNRALIYAGGGTLEKELSYQGKDLKEIAAQIDRDNNALLEYMLTGDTGGEKSFVFAGFMFRKVELLAAQMTEPEF